MAKIIRKSVDTSIEQNVLTAAIVSTKFLEDVYPIYDRLYFTNSFAKIIMGWVLDYFDQFGEAPKQHIQDIFTIEKQTLEDAETDIITIFLENLNAKYVENQGINDAYIFDQAKKYFRRRELEIRIENAHALMQIGKIDKAEEELNKRKDIIKLTADWCNPFDSEEIIASFDDRNNGIFKFPGKLGELLGEFERGWLVAWLAPFKRGKTFTLLELVVIGALCGLKTIFVSLEMKKASINKRIYKRITAYGEENKQHVVPVFDCLNNQLGMCHNVNCSGSNHALAESEDEVPTYSPTFNHTVCTNCKGSKDGNYKQATWFESVNNPEYTLPNVTRKIKSVKNMYGDNIRVFAYPRFTASVSDIFKGVDELEREEGFIADIIAVDYVGIVKPEKTGHQDGTKAIDDIWKDLAAQAAIRNVILGTASQGTRGAIYKADLGQDDIAEWIGVLGHVDAFIAINQTHKEKLKGTIRQAILAHRHKEFDEKENVTILQSLSLGQVHLDSNIKGEH